MVISNYRLPQIERPTEESLDDDDDKVLAAFEIVLSGYKKAQKRTRAITKAYNELESVAARILEELRRKENAPKPAQEVRRVEPRHDERSNRKAPSGSVETIDLTSLFTSESGESGTERTSGQSRRGGPAGNEENEPPFEGRGRQQSRPCAKIGLAKVVYSVEDVRATPQRRSRQPTLVLQPVARRTECSGSLEKRSPEKSRRVADDNLFDEDYRVRKKRESGRAPGSEATFGPEPEAIPSASRMDETARSLFDDEDNFQASPDILNTCAESSILEVVDAEESRTTRRPGDSNDAPNPVDETFFAPAERELRTAPPAALRRVDDESVDGVRAGKRKTPEEANDEAEELEVLGLQDINWDAEMSDDDWNSSGERAPDCSFHLPPKMREKSPQYAYKEKVERNKAKRSKLRGWDCWQCEQFYGKLQLSEQELRKRMDACSRHRGKFNPRYYTPKDFWNPAFPDSTDSSDCSQH